MTGTGFSDMAEKTDKLGMEDKCRGLADFLRNCKMPMTLAIQGDWGTGKSTCMNLIIEHLTENEKRPCIINFNTWQFSLVNDGMTLIYNLLSVMLNKFEELLDPGNENGSDAETNDDPKKSTKKSIKEKIALVRGFAKGLLRELATETLPGKVCYSIGDAVSGKDGDKETALSERDIALIQEAVRGTDNRTQDVVEMCVNIRSIVEKINETANDGGRIYVFIDDLDRLRPERAVEFMECLKNFMDFPGLVFVLAVDKPVVVLGLKAKYGEDFEEAKAQNFFDKIIQVPYLLPVNSYEIDSYVKDLLYGENAASDEDVMRYVELLEEFDERNPRTIKRSFNVLQLHEYMMGGELSQDDRFRLYSLLLLQLLRPRQYKELTDDIICYMDDPDDLNKKIAESMESEDPEVQKGMAIQLNGKQRVVLDCFRKDEESAEGYELESLVKFIGLTKKNGSEDPARGAGVKITEVAERIYSYLSSRSDIELNDGWKEMTGTEEAQTELSAAARCTDPGLPVRKITVKRQAESDKLNMSVFFNTVREEDYYISGLEDHFHYVRKREWDGSKPYNCYYSDRENDKRITIARFDEFTPALEEMLDRCFAPQT